MFLVFSVIRAQDMVKPSTKQLNLKRRQKEMTLKDEVEKLLTIGAYLTIGLNKENPNTTKMEAFEKQLKRVGDCLDDVSVYLMRIKTLIGEQEHRAKFEQQQ